jgi:hypothetical protein
MDADKRRKLDELRAQVRELERPERDAAKIRLAKSRRKRERAIDPADRAQRQPRQTDPGFLAYLRRQPCEARGLGDCHGPIEAAHIRYSDAAKGSMNPGMQRKNHDRHANPLCRFHHQHDQHKRAERAFWSKVGKDAYDTAAAHYVAYLRVEVEHG